MLMIHSMMWPDEVRSPEGLKIPAANYKLKPQAVKMAHQIVESMLAEFDPRSSRDESRERMIEFVQAKAAGIEPKGKAKVQDLDGIGLMAQLAASVKRHPAGKARRAAPRKRGAA